MNSINRLYKYKNWQKKTNLQAKIKGYNDTFDINLTDNNGKEDCCIGHFGYNFYIRTPKGMKSQRYKNLKSMYKAIKRVLKNNNITLESIGVKKFNKYKPLIKAV